MAEAQLLDFADIDAERFERWDISGHQINRHLINRALNGIAGFVADFIVFPPGFVHHMHRHPSADQILLPLSGSVVFQGVPEVSIDVGPEQLLLIPRDTWHEVKNVGDVDCRCFHCFNDVDSIADIGFESYEDQV